MTTTTMEANAEALFTNRSLEEIREVELRTRREANEKAEALRCDGDDARDVRCAWWCFFQSARAFVCVSED